MSKRKLKNILVPTDFSDQSANALSTAIAMCKRHHAVLHLLYVTESSVFVSPRDVNMAAMYLIPEMEEKGAEHLARCKKSIKEKYGISVQSYLESGYPADCIRKKALELNCELIVMGSHGGSGFREFFIGSNAFHVIKNTTIPVLTIPGKKKVKEFKKILFPIRVSKGVMDKYDFIEPIIEKNKATLIIAGLSLPGEPYKLGPLDEEIRRLGKSLRSSNTQFKSEHYVCKNYAKKVLQLAKKENVDLIVINASLDHKWQQFFIGPYTQQVVNHSRVAVLSIRTLHPDVIFAETVKDQMRNVSQEDLVY